MDNNEIENNRLEKVTVRFSHGAVSVIDELAVKNGRTRSDILRLIIDNRLLESLPKITFVEHEDALEYRKQLTDIFSEIEVIGSEIHRIGVNYNQELKLKHIKNKYEALGNSLEALTARQAEEEEVKKDCLPVEQLDALISRYVDATKEVGEVLCHILG